MGIISLKKSGFGPFSALAYSKSYIGWSDLTFRWISVDSKVEFLTFLQNSVSTFILGSGNSSKLIYKV